MWQSAATCPGRVAGGCFARKLPATPGVLRSTIASIPGAAAWGPLGRQGGAARWGASAQAACRGARGGHWQGDGSAEHGHWANVAFAAAVAGAALGGAANSRSQSLHCDTKPLLVVGSLNADIILEIDRFPKKGETMAASKTDTGFMVPGGKGANQAVAVARMTSGTDLQSQFVCQFGNDSHATKLKGILTENDVDIAGCGYSDKPSGQAFIFLGSDGSNSILIVGGSNMAWPKNIGAFEGLVRGASAVLLQREIPEEVNEAVAEAAFAAGVPVIQDVGGEERPFKDSLLRRLSYICPNETELERITGKPANTPDEVVKAAKALQSKGVKNVLTTLGSDGSVLVTESGEVFQQTSFPVPGGKVVDTTGAGDAFRAAFAVAFVEGRTPQQCLQFASAAGALTVSKMGAIPSMPLRKDCDGLVQSGGKKRSWW